MTPAHVPRRVDTSLVAVEIEAHTVRVGDQVMIGGQNFAVTDTAELPDGRGKRLTFSSGEIFVMRPHTVLWASRAARRRSDPNSS